MIGERGGSARVRFRSTATRGPHRRDDPDETRPGQAFLDTCPLAARVRLIAILDGVAAALPPQFTGGGMWEAMHGSRGG